MLFRVLKNLAAGWKAVDERDRLRLARELFEQSQHQEAIGILDQLLGSRPDSVDGLVLRATIKRGIGRPAEALVDLTRATALDPDNPSCLYELAAVSYVLGDTVAALENCERLRRVAPEQDAACFLLAQIELPGEHYLPLLERILGFMKPRTYVEIGVDQGFSMRLAKPPTQAIGIDPNPQLAEPPAGNHRIFAETSDAFFAGHDLHAEFGGLPLDLAFIDGLHHFEFALRDFANLERYCTRNSVILIHDCYPLDRRTSERERHQKFWTGDIWRLVVLLKKYRPDLAICTIAAPHTGLGLVRNLDPGSRFLFEHYDSLYEEFLSLDYSYLEEDKDGKLNLFPNQWDKIRTLISP